MRARQATVRIFSDEYNSSRYEEGGTASEPRMVVSPLGARVNRAFIVGVLILKENMGDDVEPFWKFQVQDPLGKFYLSAGQYQAEASASLFRIEEPALVGVVAKSRTFTTEEGDLRPSLRAERVYVVDEEVRARWTVETARHTLLRLKARRVLEEMEEPEVEKLIKMGFPREIAVGALLSLDYYPAVDYQRFKEGIITALRSVLTAPALRLKEEEVEEEKEDSKEEVFRIIKEMGEGVEYVVIDDLRKRVADLGIDEARLDEILLELMEESRIYEPQLGRLKLIE